jgi:hypothetical protein
MYRVGMYKNLRVGKIKYVTSRRIGTTNILLDAWECCFSGNSDPYTSRYNLWLVVPDEIKVGKDDVGKFCEVGFYIQSFRQKDMNASYDTILTLKSLKFIETEEEAVNTSKRISQSILNLN